MKYVRIVLASVVFLVCCACGSTIPTRPDSLGLDVPSFTIPEPQRWTLDNGMEVYFYQNEELPVMRARLYIEGGSLLDESAIPGLSSITGSQMREGGTKGFSPEELDTYLDQKAATIESSMGDEFGTVSLFCLTEDFQEILPVFASIVREPSFSPERLSLAKYLATERISHRKDNPGTIASMVFTEQVYGRNTKFARYANIDSIQKLTRDTLRKYHAAYYQPQRAKLAISGSLDETKVKELLEQAFGDWKPSATVGELSEPTPVATPQPGIYLVPRALDQATIYLGHLAAPRHTPDYYDIQTFSEIFGSGGFSSTLFQEIRTKRGLAYSVYGGIWPSLVAGTFQVGVQTRKSEALQAIAEIIKLSKKVQSELPDSEMFKEAKSSLERSFVFKFSKPESIVDRAVMLDTLKYPPDYDEKYLSRIAKVSPEGIEAAAKKWIHLEDLVIVVVGDVSAKEVMDTFPSMNVYEVAFENAPGQIKKLQ